LCCKTLKLGRLLSAFSASVVVLSSGLWVFLPCRLRTARLFSTIWAILEDISMVIF
jgi:hypothetical protein